MLVIYLLVLGSLCLQTEAGSCHHELKKMNYPTLYTGCRYCGLSAGHYWHLADGRSVAECECLPPESVNYRSMPNNRCYTTQQTICTSYEGCYGGCCRWETTYILNNDWSERPATPYHYIGESVNDTVSMANLTGIANIEIVMNTTNLTYAELIDMSEVFKFKCCVTCAYCARTCAIIMASGGEAAVVYAKSLLGCASCVYCVKANFFDQALVTSNESTRIYEFNQSYDEDGYFFNESLYSCDSARLLMASSFLLIGI